MRPYFTYARIMSRDLRDCDAAVISAYGLKSSVGRSPGKDGKARSSIRTSVKRATRVRLNKAARRAINNPTTWE